MPAATAPHCHSFGFVASGVGKGGSGVGSDPDQLWTLSLLSSLSGLSGATRRLLLDRVNELRIHIKEDPSPPKNGYGGGDG